MVCTNGTQSDCLNSGCIAIGVAVAPSPTGPLADGIGEALITSEMNTDKTHSRDHLDSIVFIDDNLEA